MGDIRVFARLCRDRRGCTFSYGFASKDRYGGRVAHGPEPTAHLSGRHFLLLGSDVAFLY
jgi:hypothetical protein